MLTAKDRIVLPVDVSTVEEARRLVDELSDYVGVFKIGLELLTTTGFEVLDIFHEHKLKIFFDGKFLDIPNTVARATAGVVRRGVDMFTIHATGGSKMMSECADACNKAAAEVSATPPIILAVTILTSIGQKMLTDELHVNSTVRDQVVSLAKTARDSGVTGIVASAEEVKDLRAALGPQMVIVTPGIRPAWAAANDQSRVVTPAQALRDGADYLVIGRPITGAANRVEAARRIIDEMESALV